MRFSQLDVDMWIKLRAELVSAKDSLVFLALHSCPQCGFLYTSDIAVRLTGMTEFHPMASLKTLSSATIMF